MIERVYALRDGSVTAHSYLDRIIEFDEKSRDYDVARRTAHLPIESRYWYLPRKRLLDQLEEGACVSTGVAHELAASPRAISGLTMDWARTRIYWPAQRNDPFAGGEYPGAQPRSGGTGVLDGVKEAQALGFYDRYEWAFDFDDGLRSLQIGPGILGLWWKSSMFEPRPSGLLEVSGRNEGGHCVAILGAVFQRKLRGEPPLDLAIVAQSWGLGHGDRGFVYIRLEDLQDLLAEDGEWCIPVERRAPRFDRSPATG